MGKTIQTIFHLFKHIKFSVLYKMEKVFFPKLIKTDCADRRSFLKEMF